MAENHQAVPEFVEDGTRAEMLSCLLQAAAAMRNGDGWAEEAADWLRCASRALRDDMPDPSPTERARSAALVAVLDDIASTRSVG